MKTILHGKKEILQKADTIHCSWSIRLWSSGGALCLLANSSAASPCATDPQESVAAGDKALAESRIWQKSLNKLFNWPGEVDNLLKAPDPKWLKSVGCICLYKHLYMKLSLCVGRKKRLANASWVVASDSHRGNTEVHLCEAGYCSIWSLKPHLCFLFTDWP